jgi:hypothetical protein
MERKRKEGELRSRRMRIRGVRGIEEGKGE